MDRPFIYYIGRTTQQMQLPLTLITCCVCIEAELELLFGSSSDLLNSHFVSSSEAKLLMAPHDKQEKMKCHV